MVNRDRVVPCDLLEVADIELAPVLHFGVVKKYPSTQVPGGV
jgi:hypothetical protein